jgi:hypothetical protein
MLLASSCRRCHALASGRVVVGRLVPIGVGGIAVRGRKLSRRSPVRYHAAAHGLMRIPILGVVRARHRHGPFLMAFWHDSSLGRSPCLALVRVRRLSEMVCGWLLVGAGRRVVHLRSRSGSKTLRAIGVAVHGRRRMALTAGIRSLGRIAGSSSSSRGPSGIQSWWCRSLRARIRTSHLLLILCVLMLAWPSARRDSLRRIVAVLHVGRVHCPGPLRLAIVALLLLRSRRWLTLHSGVRAHSGRSALFRQRATHGGRCHGL